MLADLAIPRVLGYILGHTGTNTANVQGGAALFKGTVPALVRQTTYTSIVMVCFPKVKTAIARDVRPRMPLYFISNPPPARIHSIIIGICV